MDELTAEQVWETVNGLPISTGDLAYRSIAPWGETSGWHIRGEWMHPHEALALIVDACKREMGTGYLGCSKFMKKHNGEEGWAAYYSENKCPCCGGSAEGPTESEAVLAAYKAWKEGR